MSIIVTESCTQLVSEKSPIELSTQLKMHEYEDGVKMTKISDTDNNSCSSNTDSMGILTDIKPVASFATSFQLDRSWV